MTNRPFFDGADVRFDQNKGTPVLIRGEFNLPLGDNDEESVKDFLVSHADELKMSLTDKDLKLIKKSHTETSSVLRYQQLKDALPVYGTEILVRLDNEQRIKQINLHNVDTALSADLSDDISDMNPDTLEKKALDAIDNQKQRRLMEKPDDIYFPTATGLRKAQLFKIATQDPFHDWEVIVDAQSGKILKKEDRMVESEDGKGLVFDPNPIISSGDNTLRAPEATIATAGFPGSPQATIDAERVSRTLIDITKSGNNYKLQGPFVIINGSPEETNKNNFNYTSDDDRFEGVNAYYHIDSIQRFIQSLGITNAHNTPINVEPHAAQSGASYSPFQDTIRLGHSGSSRPDRGEDGDVMVHEYGHSIQYDQVSTWGGNNPITNRSETGAMGEGFSDILACLYFSEANNGFQRAFFEDWIYADTAIGCLRRVDGTKVYPWNIANGNGGDWIGSVHSDGEIWSAALWNIYRAIGGDSITAATRLAARDQVLRTVINSHFHLTGNASMPDGAEAFMEENASDKLYLLRKGVEIIDSFHDRGILHCESGSNLKITTLWSQQDDSSIRSWEQVEAGQDNWFYATVKNEGALIARAFVVNFNFKSPFSTPVYPNDFRANTICGAVGFELAPGASITVKARWPKELIPAIPAGATKRHGCILAEVYNPEDCIAAGVTTVGASNGKLKQCNTDIVDLAPDEVIDYFLDLGNYNILRPELARLEIIRDNRFTNLEVSLNHTNKNFLKELLNRVNNVKLPKVQERVENMREISTIKILEPTRISIAMGALAARPLVLDLAAGSSVPISDFQNDNTETILMETPVDSSFMRNDTEFVDSDEASTLSFRPGKNVGFPLIIKPRDRLVVNVKIKAPRNAKIGETFAVTLRQSNIKNDIIAEATVNVRIVKKR